MVPKCLIKNNWDELEFIPRPCFNWLLKQGLGGGLRENNKANLCCALAMTCEL